MRHSLSYHLSFRPLFCLFLSGHFTQVILYFKYSVLCQKVNLFWIQCNHFNLLHFNDLFHAYCYNNYGIVYSKTCVKRPLSSRPQIGFQDQLSLNAGQKYCRMLQWEHSAILSTFIKLPFVIKTFVLSIFEWPFYTGFTVFCI